MVDSIADRQLNWHECGGDDEWQAIIWGMSFCIVNEYCNGRDWSKIDVDGDHHLCELHGDYEYTASSAKEKCQKWVNEQTDETISRLLMDDTQYAVFQACEFPVRTSPGFPEMQHRELLIKSMLSGISELANAWGISVGLKEHIGDVENYVELSKDAIDVGEYFGHSWDMEKAVGAICSLYHLSLTSGCMSGFPVQLIPDNGKALLERLGWSEDIEDDWEPYDFIMIAEGPKEVNLEEVAGPLPRGRWFAYCQESSIVFPHKGYLRNDGTWSSTMDYSPGLFGYFPSREAVVRGLRKQHRADQEADRERRENDDP